MNYFDSKFKNILKIASKSASKTDEQIALQKTHEQITL